MSLAALSYACVVLFAGSLVTGITSFGGNLVMIPLLAVIMDIKLAIVFGAYGGLIVLFALFYFYRKTVPWKESVLLGVSGLSGVPLGLWIFTNAGAKVLLLATGFCIILFLIWQIVAARLHIVDKPISMAWALPAGFFSGIMMGAATMGGPPLAIYAFARKWGKEHTISGLIVASAIMLVWVLPAIWRNLSLPPTMLKDIAIGSIFAFLGTLASLPIVHRINIRVFRLGLLLMLALSAFTLIARGIAA